MNDHERVTLLIRALLLRDVGLHTITEAVADVERSRSMPKDHTVALAGVIAERVLGRPAP